MSSPEKKGAVAVAVAWCHLVGNLDCYGDRNLAAGGRGLRVRVWWLRIGLDVRRLTSKSRVSSFLVEYYRKRVEEAGSDCLSLDVW